jgi:2,4-dienoyl-CoA reductase-like NADH-dependent reductase (Old Yellow Enzyme family)
MPVHPAAVLTRGNFRTADDAVIAPFRRLTDAIKGHGALAVQQLYHIGAHGDSDNSYHPHWSPSGGPSYHDSDGSHAMREAEILETIAGYVAAAQRCQAAGFDGIELWAAYLGLVDQFWTPWSNQRSDAWGGSLENRTRFSREILRQIRAACGERFILGLSISDQPGAEVALSRDDLAEIVALHDAEGLIDYVTCGTGGYLDFPSLMPTFLYPEKLGGDLASVVKARVTQALVVAESHIRTPENAETVLSEGGADLVSIVRGQIADPELVAKAAAGRDEDIRPCLSCNQMCWGRRSRDYAISCLVNPSVGREAQWSADRFEPAEHRRKVLVVGAGPAGLEAARVAALRGHQVILAEAGARIGGAFRLAGLQPRRGQIIDLLDWYERQLTALGVELQLGTFIDGAAAAEIAADHIILATGALPDPDGFQKAIPALARLPGIELGHVHAVEDVLSGEARPGARIVLLDEAGGWRGLGTAWKLAQQGHAVTLVSPDPMIGKELVRTSADIPLRAQLRQLGVTWRLESAIARWHGDAADVVDLTTQAVTTIAADSLILAASRHATSWVAQDLEEAGLRFVEIGDCAAPRQAPWAFYDGRRIGLSL